MAKAKIGILGSGDVGQELGRALAKHGHSVMMGTREPQREDVVAWVKTAGANASAGSNADAAKFGDIIILATGWSGTENAIHLAKPENFRGKVVLDVTNPLVFASESEPPHLALANTDSGGEQVQRWLPGAKVVKSLNIVNHAQMVDPKAFGAPTMFLCGDDAAAKKTVEGLLRQFGWYDIMDLGGIGGARWMEPLCVFWVAIGFKTGAWTHAFKLQRS